jgi:hypothetical protein
MVRGHKKNYKALKMYFDLDIYRELLWKLEKLRFETRFLPEQRIFLINGIKTPYYHIKEIIFQLNPKNDTVIMFKNKNI